jgi:tetratricopeptide (TPR) repeat protein
VAGVAAAAYQTAARDREYRHSLARGDVAFGSDQTFGAIEAYSSAIALRPGSMLAYLRRGETYQRRGDRGDLDVAARDFRTAAKLDTAATRPLEDLGDVLYQLQRYARAADAYERCLRLDDRSARVAYKLAVARYRDGDLEAALPALNQTVRLDERMTDAFYLMGVCLRGQHRTEDALRAFHKAVELSPGMIAAREELADLFGSLDRRADELEQLQLLAGLDRDHVERQVAVGLAYARRGRWEMAVLTLGAALERAPNEPLLYGALGQVWLEQSRNDPVSLGKAREALERVASSPNATSEILALYGRAQMQNGEVENAEWTLRQATTRYPVDAGAFLLYASAAEHQNHFAEARKALIEYGGLVSNDTDFVSRATRIATLSLRVNDADAAADWFRRASSASPNDVRLLIALAEAQVKAGSREAAHATIRRALEKEPGNSQLLNLNLRARSEK